MIENENRKTLMKPDPDNLREMEAFVMQMRAIEESKDDESTNEAQFAKLTRELEELECEMESINDRKKKIQLISD